MLDSDEGAVPLGSRLAADSTLLSVIVQERRPLIIRDVTEVDYPETQVLAGEGVRSTLHALMTIGDEVVGTLNISSADVDAFDPADASLLSQIGSLLASNLQNQHLLSQTQKRAAEMQTVAEVGVEAATSLDTVRLLKHVSNLAKERFGLYHMQVYLLDDTGALQLVAGAGEVGEQMVASGHRIAATAQRSLAAQAVQRRETVVVNDVYINPSFLPNPMLPFARAEMAIPMIVGGQVLGVMDVQADRTNAFTDEDVLVQSTLASQVAVAVQNARLYGEQVEVAEQLREVDRLKSEFLASMSHELRTPLNSIIGYAEVLLDGIDGELNDDMEEDVGAIHSSGKHLLSLINDVLDLAKIEAGQMDLLPEPFDMTGVIEDMINTSRVLVRDKPVELRWAAPVEPLMINGDVLRVRQILNNLLTNAIKFTEEGSITVAAQADSENSDMIRVSVSDTGIGLQDDQVLVIFDRFRQVDQSHTRRAGGTGLGLSITRQLVELHGGRIWVDSAVGAGSTFFFTLPVARETALAE
jgi:signal transduction histidine kinase